MERYLTKTEKIAAFREKYLPVWVILPLISIFVLNCLIYWGSGVLTADRYHFDFTMSLDRAVPLIPQFIWIYILNNPVISCNRNILAGLLFQTDRLCAEHHAWFGISQFIK